MRFTAAVSSLLLLGAAPVPVTQGDITSLEVRFFDPTKGEFSSNVLKDDAYSGWNDFMTEGNGGYGRGDALVLVHLALPKRDGRNFVIDGPLTVTVHAKTKTLVKRSFAGINVPSNGKTVRAVFVQNIGCSGRLDVLAKLRDHLRRARLDMACGE
jgi:hypothetical protein